MPEVKKSVKYVTLHSENIEKYKTIISPLNDDYLFLFDIDETLFQFEKEFNKAEIASWKEVFYNLQKQTSETRSFHEILMSCPMWGGGFYRAFEITAKKADDLRGFFDYKKYISKDELLKKTLDSLSCRKWCFTNGLKCRAEAILQCLGIEECFEGIICIDDNEMGTRGKPFDFAYNFVESLFKITKKDKIYFFDDNKNNVEKGNTFNWNTFLIDEKTNLVQLLDYLKEKLNLEVER
ncbi:hypothetical protein NCER_101613 [Vairimorpha ceranae BRL01]|uniref:Pyrimidine 5-nucleotidase n=2 Tax=Vairimorpha ceranae TaxID=40302 RepID=C4VAE7_VAIC1|nr:pyrimidine 5 -nucleotidase [Vairimorpha ceranae]EEQ81802.1 hypothetical protein NCER_101613 [Vairimorpha ceranae BRL01]KAF5141417.1 hypothetical protein G9O61_00g004160 [Vairimorpha ceranae]KKO74654.1 pyrimidine 5 -nucleotidase [Vairimorpha ceranae]